MAIIHIGSEPSRRTIRLRLGRLASVVLPAMRTGLAALHGAIVAAKLRRLEREWLLRDMAKASPRFPQAPMILGDKWDF